MVTRTRVLMLVVVASGGVVFAQGRAYLPAEIENGMRLYQANCIGCHGPEGDAVGGVSFPAGRYRRVSTDDEMVRAIVNGIPGTAMPPSGFSDGVAGTIVAYLRSMAASGERAAAAGDPGRGEALFLGKAQCVGCHSVAGAGGRSGPSLTEIGAMRRAAELERSLLDPGSEIRPENRSVRIVTRGGETVSGRLLNQYSFTVQLLDRQGSIVSLEKTTLREINVLEESPMPSYRDKLTATELGDVLAYLRSLRGRS